MIAPRAACDAAADRRQPGPAAGPSRCAAPTIRTHPANDVAPRYPERICTPTDPRPRYVIDPESGKPKRVGNYNTKWWRKHAKAQRNPYERPISHTACARHLRALRYPFHRDDGPADEWLLWAFGDDGPYTHPARMFVFSPIHLLRVVTRTLRFNPIVFVMPCPLCGAPALGAYIFCSRRCRYHATPEVRPKAELDKRKLTRTVAMGVTLQEIAESAPDTIISRQAARILKTVSKLKRSAPGCNSAPTAEAASTATAGRHQHPESSSGLNSESPGDLSHRSDARDDSRSA